MRRALMASLPLLIAALVDCSCDDPEGTGGSGAGVATGQGGATASTTGAFMNGSGMMCTPGDTCHPLGLEGPPGAILPDCT